MELLLRQDVPKLGRAGDVVQVRPGYARNFLLPKRLAMEVSAENIRVVAKERKRRDAEAKKQLDELRAIAARLADATCTIEEKVAEGGHLYGSVTAAKIAGALQKMGFPVEEKAVRLDSHIKERGTFPVLIHLHPEVEVTTHIVVEAQPE